MGLNDLLIDPADKDAMIAALEESYETMKKEASEAEDLLAEVIPVLKAVGKGEQYPADKAEKLHKAVMDRVWFLVVPPEKEGSYLVDRHLKLVKT